MRRKLAGRIAAAAAMFLTAAAPALASPVSYMERVTDNSGNLVPGASLSVGGTVLTAGAATSVPAGAGGRLLSTGAAPGAAVSVTYYDLGTGDYVFVVDPAAQGELYLPLTASKAGSTITGGNALLPLLVTRDSAQIAALQFDGSGYVSSHDRANDDKTGYAVSSVGDKTGYGLAPGQNVATVGGVAPPANWNLAAIDGAGRVTFSNTTIASAASVTGSVGSVSGSVGSVSGSVGSLSGVTFPSNFGAFSLDASGRVTLAPGQSTVASNFVPAPAVVVDGSGRVLLQPSLVRWPAMRLRLARYTDASTRDARRLSFVPSVTHTQAQWCRAKAASARARSLPPGSQSRVSVPGIALLTTVTPPNATSATIRRAATSGIVGGPTRLVLSPMTPITRGGRPLAEAERKTETVWFRAA